MMVWFKIWKWEVTTLDLIVFGFMAFMVLVGLLVAGEP